MRSKDAAPAHGFQVTLPDAAAVIAKNSLAVLRAQQRFQRTMNDCLLRFEASQPPRPSNQPVINVNVGSAHASIIHQNRVFLCTDIGAEEKTVAEATELNLRKPST